MSSVPATTSPASPGSIPDIYQNGPSTSDQFLRKWSLTLIGSGGEWTISDSNAAGALSGGSAGPIADPLRITFQTRQISTSSRGTLEATIFNLSLSHPASGLNKLYNRVVLRAGYQTGRFGIIFDGTIVGWHQGRTPGLTETYLKILGGDGDFPYNVATVNMSTNKNVQAKDMVQNVAKQMVAVGAILGKVVGISTTKLIRTAVHYGMAADALRKYTNMFIDNGTLNLVQYGHQFQSGETVNINANSGLIGMAEINSANGVDFDCNLNPTLQVYSQVVIDNKDINTATGTTSNIPGTTNQTEGAVPTYGQRPGFFVDPSADGTYTALVIEHSGDSRGNEWQTHVKAWPNGTSPTPDTTIFQGYGLDPSKAQVKAAVDPPILPPDPNLPTWTGPLSTNQTPGI